MGTGPPVGEGRGAHGGSVGEGCGAQDGDVDDRGGVHDDTSRTARVTQPSVPGRAVPGPEAAPGTATPDRAAEAPADQPVEVTVVLGEPARNAPAAWLARLEAAGLREVRYRRVLGIASGTVRTADLTGLAAIDGVEDVRAVGEVRLHDDGDEHGGPAGQRAR